MRTLSISAASLLFTASIRVASAQESRATIIGRASDPSGAVLTGANVKATNIATNAIDRALRVVEKHGIPLALENHKDWTAAEIAALKSSEQLGVCLDTGNNISLLDDPMEVVETLAPYAVSTHLKDMAVARYKDGFLLSEMPFGEGFLNLKQIVESVRRARPKTKITHEMITLNPLEVPCLTEKYWVTFPDRNGKYLARTLRMVDANSKKQVLPRIDHLDKPAQARLEEENVKQCLYYARQQLAL